MLPSTVSIKCVIFCPPAEIQTRLEQWLPCFGWSFVTKFIMVSRCLPCPSVCLPGYDSNDVTWRGHSNIYLEFNHFIPYFWFIAFDNNNTASQKLSPRVPGPHSWKKLINVVTIALVGVACHCHPRGHGYRIVFIPFVDLALEFDTQQK